MPARRGHGGRRGGRGEEHIARDRRRIHRRGELEIAPGGKVAQVRVHRARDVGKHLLAGIRARHRNRRSVGFQHFCGFERMQLHAFNAAEVLNTDTPPIAVPGPNAGKEMFAYVPRTVYPNLGNLTARSNFKFAPTVDATPVTRDVFFPTATSTPAVTTAGWHTLLVGGLRLGGRGVYALDITDPTQVTEANANKAVLWEFNSDTPAVTGVGDPADLGYTFGQPNIGRLANGKWVVLVPGGYFPDCSK